MKATDGCTRTLPSALVVSTALLSLWPLALAMRRLAVGTAYAVRVGIGAAGAAVLDVLLPQEPASIGRIVWLLLIAAGVVGLKAFSGA